MGVETKEFARLDFVFRTESGIEVLACVSVGQNFALLHVWRLKWWTRGFLPKAVSLKQEGL
jgi:hypothetical protein